MDLLNNPNVYFESLSHTYLLGDKELIGVTSLLKKHGLSPDYEGIPQAVLDKAAAVGTSLHQEIEDYDNGASVLTSPLIETYRDTCQQMGLNFVCNELLVSDEETHASFIDGVYTRSEEENHYVLVDYKSTSKIHFSSVTWQLNIYKYDFERQFPGAVVDAIFVMHIDKKKNVVDGCYPLDIFPDNRVQDLIDAERNGQIYIDTHDAPDASLVLTDEELQLYVSNATLIAELKERISVIEDGISGFNARLLKYMEDKGLSELPAPGGVIKRKAATKREGVDTKKLKEKYPNIYEFVRKVSPVSGSVSFKPKK